MPADGVSTARTEAPAKINLALFVGGRRADGFHELVTIFQAITLSDLIEVDVSAPTDRHRPVEDRLVLTVEGPDLGPLEDNLAYRAAHAFLTEAGDGREVAVRLEKRIPAGAGLGGGSSDAAAVLRCLASLTGRWDLLESGHIGASLGSDVPFFLGDSPTAVGRGRGELIEAIPALPVRPLAVALPTVHVATSMAYRDLAASRGERPPALPTIEGDLSWARITGGLARNDFEPVVSGSHPEIVRSLEALRGTDAELVMLSGSGAASFAVFSGVVPGAEGGDGIAGLCGELTRSLGWPVVPGETRAELPGVYRT